MGSLIIIILSFQIPFHYDNYEYVQLLKAIDLFYKNKVSRFYSTIIKDRLVKRDLFHTHLLVSYSTQNCKIWRLLWPGEIPLSTSKYIYHVFIQLFMIMISVSVCTFIGICSNSLDRCYCEEKSSKGRQSSLTTQFYLLDVLIHSLAPIIPHLTEDIYFHYPPARRKPGN